MLEGTYKAAANQVAKDLKTLREVIMFEETKTFCPICNHICAGDEEKHRHIEEKHNNLMTKDVELMEKTSGKELLNE